MYSFLPKVAQQLGQLAKMNKNPYINNPNPTFEPPEGPGNVYKNLLAGDKERFYRNYDNKWYVAGERDGQDWRDISKEGWNEMLNNKISMNPAQNDEQYDNNEVGFDPRLYRQGNPEYKETSPIAYAQMPDQTAGLGMFNVPITPKDMGGTGVLASNMPFPKVNTPELDMLMGKTEAPLEQQQGFEPPIPLLPETERLKNLQGIPNKVTDIIEPEPDSPYEAIFNPGQALAMEEGQSGPELGGANEIPPSLAEQVIKSLSNIKGYKPNFTGYKPNLIGDDGDASLARADYDGDITNIRSNVEGDGDISYVNRNITNTTNTTNVPPKNKFGTPEAYYLGKSILDATALINNMVQPQPPSIQMKLPHYERQRLNPEPYDAMRSQMRDQGTQAYRLQRENISQASDLMKGLAAVTYGTQQGLMQVGMQQAGAEQQIQAINQQISAQEQAAQTQILNQEATTNYQIQAQAQQFKDQMISAQLARLGDTAGAYAKYANMKDIATKQDLVNKAAIQSTNEIQNAMLQYQLQKDAMDSDEYKSAWSQHWNKSLDQLAINKLNDEKYNLVKEYYGETTPSYGDFRRRATNPVFIQDYYQKRNAYDMFQKLYPGGVAPDRSKYSNDTDYNNALADFKKYEQDSKAYNDNKSYKTFEQEQDFWTTLSKEKNENAERKKFADQYMKDRGIFTSEQLMESIQASLDRSRQALEIGG